MRILLSLGAIAGFDAEALCKLAGLSWKGQGHPGTLHSPRVDAISKLAAAVAHLGRERAWARAQRVLKSTQTRSPSGLSA